MLPLAILPETTEAFPNDPLCTVPEPTNVPENTVPEARCDNPIAPLLIFPLLTALLPMKPDVTIPEERLNPAGIVPEAKCILPI